MICYHISIVETITLSTYLTDRVPAVPLLGTPDSRVTSLEGGTTKSCATIPEDDEDVSPSCERIDDLVSIDRVISTFFSYTNLLLLPFNYFHISYLQTSVSMSEQKGGANRYYFSNSNYNLFMPQVPPEFQVFSLNSIHFQFFIQSQTF